MAQVKAKVKCFIDNTLREEGDVFEYNGVPNGCVAVVKANKNEDEAEIQDGSEISRSKPKGKRNAADTSAA